MPATWQTALVRGWASRGPLAAILWPVSLVYGALAAVRRQFYRWGALKTHRADTPVIVVGNVVAGGAGKTPSVIAIVQHLQRQNRRVAVISRGYGRQGKECLEVHADSDPRDVGDEPLLIQRATQATVFVAPTRAQAATAVLQQYPQTEIIVCDDGLQHYALYRDLEVCVFDDRGCGNQFLLPAGPLREPWPRHAVAAAGQDDERLLVLHTGQKAPLPGYHAQRSLAPIGKRCDGSFVALSTLGSPDGKPLLALAGIAQPGSFFTMLRAVGLHVEQTLALPDHYDFDSFSRTSFQRYQLICTEKDAAKLWSKEPTAIAVPLHLQIDPAFFAAMDYHLAARSPATLSSGHGHQTT